jgi:hypothetical protein
MTEQRRALAKHFATTRSWDSSPSSTSRPGGCTTALEVSRPEHPKHEPSNRHADVFETMCQVEVCAPC